MVTARSAMFSAVTSNSTTELIVRRIGEAIGSGVLDRGERLPTESDLAEQLGVAPMTIRQALAILREAGFIETRRGRQGGSFVRDDAEDAIGRLSADTTRYSLAWWRDLTDWRRAVSGEAAGLAAERRTPADLVALRERYSETHRLVGTYEDYRMADARFHVHIAEITRSTQLVAAETQAQATLTGFLLTLPRSTTATELSDDQHRPIVNAIVRGQPRAARDAMVDHIEATHEWIIGLRLGHLAP